MAVGYYGDVYLVRTPVDITDTSNIAFVLWKIPNDGINQVTTWTQDHSGISTSDYMSIFDYLYYQNCLACIV